MGLPGIWKPSGGYHGKLEHIPLASRPGSIVTSAYSYMVDKEVTRQRFDFEEIGRAHV